MTSATSPAPSGETVLLLGGSGLVGFQVARRMASEIAPRRIVIVALGAEEVQSGIDRLRPFAPGIEIDGYFGDVFGRGDLTHVGERAPTRSRNRDDAQTRHEIFRDTYVDFDGAFAASSLVRLLKTVQPTTLVDTVNTATAISYQDVPTQSRTTNPLIERFHDAAARGDADALQHAHTLADEAERLIASLSTPQLILHVRLLERAFRELREAGTPVRVYVKVGTTGTGGMGLNIPYTHGEERPSGTLMTKTAMGFAHTGLLFLLARTPGMPIVKEVKPAAMIGYRTIALKPIRGRVWHNVNGKLTAANEIFTVTRADAHTLNGVLDTTPRTDLEPVRAADGTPRQLQVPCIDTGENGLFTRGEFEAITAWRQMEYVTPEEIADLVTLEVRGANTGKDVIGALDSSVLGPSYRAGLLRHQGLHEVELLERQHGIPSVAIGRLGPPQLAKLLYESHLFAECFGTLAAVLGEDGSPPRTPQQLSARLYEEATQSDLVHVAATLGIPTLTPDGRTLLRGPSLRSPEFNPLNPQVALADGDLARWAERAWIDLRPVNMERWLARFRVMRGTAHDASDGWASDLLTHDAYPHTDIRIGSVVAWIFANEMGGYRIT